MRGRAPDTTGIEILPSPPLLTDLGHLFSPRRSGIGYPQSVRPRAVNGREFAHASSDWSRGTTHGAAHSSYDMSAFAQQLAAPSLAAKKWGQAGQIRRVSPRQASTARPARGVTVASIRQQQQSTTGASSRPHPSLFHSKRRARTRAPPPRGSAFPPPEQRAPARFGAAIVRGDLFPPHPRRLPGHTADNPADPRRSVPSISVYRKSVESRDSIRMGIPSKGRMAEDTMDLLRDCQLKVRKINPRQYAAEIPNVPGMEVWFQRATDVVRKLISGDIDIGIVGYDMLREIGNENEDLVVVHDALGFGGCHLAVAVPQAWDDVESLRDLLSDKRWSKERPLRVVTAYMNLAEQFFADQGFEHVELSTADGALEAAPAMGAADCILDLVSSGTTLRRTTSSRSRVAACSNPRASSSRPAPPCSTARAREIIHEMLERLEAHLRADGLFMVTANVRGSSAEEVATRLANDAGQLLRGLQGPTISPIYTPSADGSPSKEARFYAVSFAVPRTRIYETVKELRKNGGSGVLTFPLTYVFDEEPPRWNALMNNLGLDPSITTRPRRWTGGTRATRALGRGGRGRATVGDSLGTNFGATRGGRS